jgi:hypothetical protein
MSNKLAVRDCINIAYRSFPIERAREWGHIWHNVLDDIDMNSFDEEKIKHAIEVLKKGMEREATTRING